MRAGQQARCGGLPIDCKNVLINVKFVFMIVHIQYLIEAAKMPVIFIKLSESIRRVAFDFIVLF